jgi:hypothetical protein
VPRVYDRRVLNGFFQSTCCDPVVTAAHHGSIQMIDSTSRAHQQAATARREIEIIVSVEHTVARSRSMSSTRESFRSGSAWRWAKPMMADR